MEKDKQVFFGYINLETRTSHDGYIDENGKMAFKKEGSPISEDTYSKTIVHKKPEDLPPKIQQEIISRENWVTAPRWGRFSTFLKKAAMYHGVKVEILSEEGWINVTTFYKVTGIPLAIFNLNNQIESTLHTYVNR